MARRACPIELNFTLGEAGFIDFDLFYDFATSAMALDLFMFDGPMGMDRTQLPSSGGHNHLFVHEWLAAGPLHAAAAPAQGGRERGGDGGGRRQVRVL